MLGSKQIIDTVIELATPSKLELDLGNESIANTATLIADCNNSNVKEMSFVLQSLTRLLKEV
jgi:hypothetical protein